MAASLSIPFGEMKKVGERLVDYVMCAALTGSQIYWPSESVYRLAML